MNLYTDYIKILRRKICRDYIYVVCSIITNYIAIAVCSIVIDNLFLLLKMDSIYGLAHLKGSLQAILLMAGCGFIGKQYHDIMRLNTVEYSFLRAMGTTRKYIRRLSAIRILLFPATILSGVFLGFYGTQLIVNMLTGLVISTFLLQMIDSVNTFLFITTSMCFIILLIGIYHDKKVKKKQAVKLLLGFTAVR